MASRARVAERDARPEIRLSRVEGFHLALRVRDAQSDTTSGRLNTASAQKMFNTRPQNAQTTGARPETCLSPLDGVR